MHSHCALMQFHLGQVSRVWLHGRSCGAQREKSKKMFKLKYATTQNVHQQSVHSEEIDADAQWIYTLFSFRKVGLIKFSIKKHCRPFCVNCAREDIPVFFFRVEKQTGLFVSCGMIHSLRGDFHSNDFHSLLLTC